MMSQPRSIQPGPSRDALKVAFGLAFSSAQKRLPGNVREDDLSEAALKWWKYVCRDRFPDFLLVDGEISVEFLAGWLIRAAKERRDRQWKVERTRRAAGFELVSDTADDGEPRDVPDRTARSVEDVAVGRIAASQELAALCPIREIDVVVRYRALEFSYEEIGDALGIQTGAARVRGHRATKRLASKLNEAAALSDPFSRNANAPIGVTSARHLTSKGDFR